MTHDLIAYAVLPGAVDSVGEGTSVGGRDGKGGGASMGGSDTRGYDEHRHNNGCYKNGDQY